MTSSRFAQRAMGAAAVVTIVLLIIVIALLWTGVGTGVFNTQRAPPETRRSRTGLEPRPQPKEATTIFSGGGYSSEDSDDEGGDDDDSVTLFDEDVHGDDHNKEWTKQRKLSIDEGGTSAQIEYVKPLKISPPPLHEQDILYGGDFDNTQPPLRHHSGHFRHKMAVLWDPHPQYEFSAFGKSFRLVLAQDAAFVHPELQVTHIWHNMTIRERPSVRPNGCFYKGLVRGDPHSTVAVSLCHGMTGHIRTSFGSFFIEPVEHWHDHTTPILHALYRIPGHNNNAATEVEGLHQCGVADEDYPWRAPAAMTMDPNMSSLTSGPVQYVGGKRTRRSMATGEYRRSYTVEMLVVADKKMAEYHGEGLQHYILTLMSIVSQIYKDASVGNPISIAVVNLHILKDVEFVPRDSRSRNSGHDGISAAEMLRNFCAWQSTVNTKDDSNTNHHDTSLLLTRENICRNPEKRKCDTLGLAELGKMCDHNSSCAIVQDNGLSAAFTIAHELGHVLNMPHDDDQKCTRYRDGSKIHNVMSRMLDHNTYPWAWSECSQQVLTEFLDAGYGRCLLDKPYRDLVSAEQARRHSQPGESFPEDRQCQLVFGESSRICSYMPVCKRLWCTTDPSEKEGCRTQYMPWADGTPCAPGRWCQRGECVNRTQLPKVDGGWGSWQPFGDCSRSCGGGVKRSERKCNNPAPSNGGDYCTGQRTRYRSCNTRACPPGSRDYREEQCAAFNNNTFNIQGLPENVKWVPKYGIFSSDERCKLYCRVQGNSAYYPLREKVGDGTSCGPDTFDMCVNGICRQAGCDHVLGSRRKLDMCGKCGGDNSSCVPIKGRYNNSKYGYSSVVRIPAGSSNLDIKQYGHNGLNDDNYLALRDEENGQYILNGEYMVTIFRKLVVFDGGTLEYSGSSAIIERINSSSRPLKKSLIVEVLSVGSLTPPNITYQYTVQRDSHFKWELGDKWSDCDKPCNGNRWLWPVCVQLDNSVVVSDEHCANLADDHLERPVEPCNTHCTLKWRSRPVSECSAECGRGTRTMSVECVQQFGESKMATVTDDTYCEHLPRPPEQEDCEGPCNSTHWEYGEWGPCPVTCGGGGVHSRMVQCVNERGQPVEAALCSDEPAPITERNCGIQECPRWVLGQLSPCSVSCGAGERTHSLWCQVGEQMVTEVYCESLPKPRDYKESCTLEPCASWQLGPWNQCSVTCGGSGKQTRIVRCISLEGHEVDDSACYGEERPSETQPCEADQPCPNDYYGSILGSSSTTSASLEDDWQHHNSMFPTESSYIDNVIPHGNREDNNVLPPIARKLFHPQNKISFIPQPAAMWVVSDWEPCSVTCGKGVKRRSVSCADTVLGTPVDRQQCHMLADSLEPSVSEPCGENLPPCASWQVGDWEPCSVTCGKGTTKRKLVCINKDNGAVLENEKVCEENNLARPIKEKECEHLECPSEPQYKWRTGPWGECSKSCGGGYMRRMVVCASEDGDTSEEKCSTSERLVDKVQCNDEPCPTWNTGAWSECSKSCGEGGYQQRQVRCQLHSGGILLDSACSIADRPQEERKCNHMPCPEISYIDSGQGDRPYVSKKVYQWRTGAWAQCSKSCGKGLRRRQVVCVAVTPKEWRVVERYYPHFRGSTSQQRKIHPSEVVVRDIHCNPALRPKATRICKRHQCPYTWVEGEWSECSQTCGHGMRQRTVGCYKVAGGDWQPRTSELCDASEKPAEQEACILAHCHDEYHWEYGTWLPCSHECGKKGRQKRHLFCKNREGKKVRRNLCAQDKKPQHKRKCNQHRCVYSSCSDAQTRLRTKDDKEYLMRVSGSSAMAHIRIFCQGMASDSPKEYLTLAAGERDNFAEIYDRRLESAETCPFNGQRRDNCPCRQLDPQDKWGLTVFSKIRLNITSLRVITQDFTFSRQVKGQRVKYAEAGDCYSKVRCPQGRFSINLQGTGLQVSADTRWEGHGSDPHIIINRTEGNVKVDGKCGGYCGTCSPNVQHGLKLDVLPP